MLVQEFFNFLVQHNNLDEDLIREDLSETDSSIQKLRQFLLSRRYLTEEGYLKSLSEYLKLDYLDPLPEVNEADVKVFTDRVSPKLVYKNIFFPIEQALDSIKFAINDPAAITVCEEIAESLFKRATFCLAKEAQIINLIQRDFKISPGVIDQEDKAENENLMEAEDLLSSDDEEPIRRLVNSMLFQALKTNASDIHIDATADETLVRNRVDGILQQVSSYPKHGHNRIINRVKVMSGLDISTRNIPQDGRALIKLAGKKVDIRVSVIPTIHGERVVLRLLQQSHQLLNIAELDFLPKVEKKLLAATNSPNGIILVTGPTGSGKTTTLYACLQSVNHTERNVITIEDPVEYQISGYGQVQVNEKQGLTFASGLRTILRQDPDVIMVGEIRDLETAQIAIQSALTGHLVLSTLHTNDAVSTIVRLFDMDIEPFLVSSTLKCVLSQRLVRKLCLKCRKKVTMPFSDLAKLGAPKGLAEIYKGFIYEPKGCSECNSSGYAGRMGVHEFLELDDALKEAVNQNNTAVGLRNIALESGCLLSLAEDAFTKLIAGQTSLPEINRLLYEVKLTN